MRSSTCGANAEYREERYCALALAGAKQYTAFRTFDMLPMLEEMVITGAWWDFVDEVGTHRLRELFGALPEGNRAAYEVVEPGHRYVEAPVLDHLPDQSKGTIPISVCSSTVSSLTCRIPTSLYGRESAGRCGHWHGPI